MLILKFSIFPKSVCGITEGVLCELYRNWVEYFNYAKQ